MSPRLLLLLALVAASAASAADKLVVTAKQDCPLARPSEMISVPWKDVARVLPGAMIHHLAVKDAAGRILAYQVTNLAPLAKDPRKEGGAYGELLFQHDFAAGENTATFTIETIAELAPVFPTKTFARFVPERLDDFAWENDKVAHRTYGPALAAPAEPGSGKEVLVSSGLDLWVKRVGYPIVDRWYNMGHDYYHHHDLAEGMDLYNVGTSCGLGGTGLWDGKQLVQGRNYRSWRVLANGPIRTVFELTYEAWTVGAVKVAEVKRFTVDAGHNLDLIESTFTLTGTAETVAAVGLCRNPSDKGQEPVESSVTSPEDGSVSQWIVQKVNGSIGTAVVVLGAKPEGFTDDARNHLVLVRVTGGQPLRYLAGAGWSKAGEFTTAESWNAYVHDCAVRARHPLQLSLAAQP